MSRFTLEGAPHPALVGLVVLTCLGAGGGLGPAVMLLVDPAPAVTLLLWIAGPVLGFYMSRTAVRWLYTRRSH